MEAAAGQETRTVLKEAEGSPRLVHKCQGRGPGDAWWLPRPAKCQEGSFWHMCPSSLMERVGFGFQLFPKPEEIQGQLLKENGMASVLASFVCEHDTSWS